EFGNATKLEVSTFLSSGYSYVEGYSLSLRESYLHIKVMNCYPEIPYSCFQLGFRAYPKNS
ncbi:MAG TPA: hypothetical protein V6D31_08790, partial [Candidatus Sericytochromatia bacterium]